MDRAEGRASASQGGYIALEHLPAPRGPPKPTFPVSAAAAWATTGAQKGQPHPGKPCPPRPPPRAPGTTLDRQTAFTPGECQGRGTP